VVGEVVIHDAENAAHGLFAETWVVNLHRELFVSDLGHDRHERAVRLARPRDRIVRGRELDALELGRFDADSLRYARSEVEAGAGDVLRDLAGAPRVLALARNGLALPVRAGLGELGGIRVK